MEEIVDKPSQRNFVRVQVKQSTGGDEVILRVNPRMLSVVQQSRGLPLPFVTGGGMAFGAQGVLPTGPRQRVDRRQRSRRRIIPVSLGLMGWRRNNVHAIHVH